MTNRTAEEWSRWTIENDEAIGVQSVWQSLIADLAARESDVVVERCFRQTWQLRAEKAEETNAWYAKRCTWYKSEIERVEAERDAEEVSHDLIIQSWKREELKWDAERSDLTLRLEQMRGWLEKIIGWMEGGNEEANATADELRAFLSATPPGELAREVREVLTYYMWAPPDHGQKARELLAKMGGAS